MDLEPPRNRALDHNSNDNGNDNGSSNNIFDGADSYHNINEDALSSLSLYGEEGQDQFQNFKPPPSPPSPPQIQQQQEDFYNANSNSDSADWDTRRKIFLVEVIVVTLIVGTVLFFCFRRHHRKLTRRRRVFSTLLQEWTTIRVAPSGDITSGDSGRMIRVESISGGVMDLNLEDVLEVSRNSGIVSVGAATSSSRGHGRMRMDSNMSGMGLDLDVSRNSGIISRGSDGRLRMDSNISGMGAAISMGRDGRIRVDSDIGNMMSAASLPQPQASTNVNNNNNNTDNNEEVNNNNNNSGRNNTRRRMGNRSINILAIPRTIGHFLMTPLRLLEAGVNDWATTNPDEVFLRQFMERLEADQEAQRENAGDREVRLKAAFVKECMIWELDEENFIPPKDLWGDDDEDDERDDLNNDPREDDNCQQGGTTYGLYSLGDKANNNAVPDMMKDLEEGKVEEHDHDNVNVNVNNTNWLVPQSLEEMPTKAEMEDDNMSGGETKVNEVDLDTAVEGKKVAEGNGIERDENEEALEESPARQTSKQEPDVTHDDIRLNEVNVPAGESDLSDASSTTRGDVPSEDVHVHVSTTEPSTLPPPMLHDIEKDDDGNTTEKTKTTTTTVSSSAPAQDTFDEEASSPGYLYLNLNTSNHGRRSRANTNESNETTNNEVSSSYSQHSKLSNAESMETISSTTPSLTSTTVSSSSSSSDTCTSNPHKITNQCAICLCDYEKGDTIVTSCNSECPHAFHQECIVEWLVKMQEGTPCPCCRRQFVELDEYIPRINNNTNSINSNNINSNSNSNATAPVNSSSNNATNDTAQDPAEAERLREERQERRRRRIELGLQRGGRAFNTSVISMRSGSNSNNDNASRTPEEVERVREERAERRRRNIELGLRRGGRAFNTSVISMR